MFPITQEYAFHVSFIRVGVPLFSKAWQADLITKPWQIEHVIAGGSESTPAHVTANVVSALTRVDVLPESGVPEWPVPEVRVHMKVSER